MLFCIPCNRWTDHEREETLPAQYRQERPAYYAGTGIPEGSCNCQDPLGYPEGQCSNCGYTLQADQFEDLYEDKTKCGICGETYLCQECGAPWNVSKNGCEAVLDHGQHDGLEYSA